MNIRGLKEKIFEEFFIDRGLYISMMIMTIIFISLMIFKVG